MLRTLPESYKSHWKDHLNKVVHAYNCTQHESTGYSPFYLIFGRYLCLPIDLVFNLKPPVENKSYPKYVADWQSAMKEAYSIAASKSKAQGDKAKVSYDLKFRSSTLLPGDRVLIKNLSERDGPGKLRSYWKDKVHVVVHRKSPDSPVYQLKPENGTGPIRTLHRNLLFPCSTLLESSSTPRQASPGQQELKPSTTLSKRKSQRSSKSTHPTRPSPESTEQSDDDEDSDFVLVHENVPQLTSSSVLSPFAPAFKSVPEPPEEPTTERAALIGNPSQAMLEIPPHSPIPDLPSNDFGNSALADGGPVDTPAPAADATESLQDQEGAEQVESVEPHNILSSSSVEHPSESDTTRPQRVLHMPGNPVYCNQNLAQVQNIGTDYSVNNYRAFGQPTFRNQFGLPPPNFPAYNYQPYLPQQPFQVIPHYFQPPPPFMPMPPFQPVPFILQPNLISCY